MHVLPEWQSRQVSDGRKHAKKGRRKANAGPCCNGAGSTAQWTGHAICQEIFFKILRTARRPRANAGGGAGEAVKNKLCYSRGLAFRGRCGRHKSPLWAGGMLSRQAQSSAQRSRRRQQPFRQQGRAPVTGGAFFFRQLLAVPAAAGPGHGQQPGQGDLFAAVHAQAAAAAAQIAQQAFQGADARRA